MAVRITMELEPLSRVNSSYFNNQGCGFFKYVFKFWFPMIFDTLMIIKVL